MKLTRRVRTADELLTELERDPVYVERQRRWAEEERENVRRYDEASAPLLGELSAAGLELVAVRDLKAHGDPGVLPIVSRFLRAEGYLPVKQDTVAALTGRWARRAAGSFLVEEFKAIDPAADSQGQLRWSIGDVLEHVADERVIDDVITISLDQRHGSHRGFVVVALGNMRRAREKVEPILLRLLQDPDVAGYAIMGLAKLGATDAIPAITPFLKHPAPWVRREAKKALARLEKKV